MHEHNPEQYVGLREFLELAKQHAVLAERVLSNSDKLELNTHDIHEILHTLKTVHTNISAIGERERVGVESSRLKSSDSSANVQSKAIWNSALVQAIMVFVMGLITIWSTFIAPHTSQK